MLATGLVTKLQLVAKILDLNNSSLYLLYWKKKTAMENVIRIWLLFSNVFYSPLA